MGLRAWVAVCLWMAGVTAVVGVIAGGLTVVLALLGDDFAARGVVGVALVAAVCFVVDLIAILLMLAAAYVSDDFDVMDFGPDCYEYDHSDRHSDGREDVDAETGL